MINKANKNQIRKNRHLRVRNKVSGTAEAPRLAVYRSLNAIYAQIIDDTKGVTLAQASTLDKALKAECQGKPRKEQARIVGAEIAKRALAKNIKNVVFDRGGYLYAGRVEELTNAAREAGLEF